MVEDYQSESRLLVTISKLWAWAPWRRCYNISILVSYLFKILSKRSIVEVIEHIFCEIHIFKMMRHYR
jgi:hypothetical protein